MEYAKDSEFLKDFVLRTKANISMCQSPYEVTQLVNSLIGLLILPKEQYYQNIQDDMINSQLLTTIKQKITINSPEKNYNLKQIVRRLRNAIAHFNIECKADIETHEIDHIIFSDFDHGNDSQTPNFQISLSVDLMKKFVYQFSESISNIVAEEIN